jgi:hypothetical protein
MASTYIVNINAISPGSAKNMIDVFNPAASGKLVKVYRIWVENNMPGPAVTGVTTIFKIFRTTAASAGLTLVPVSFDSTNVALGTVSAGAGRTLTTTSLFRNCFISNDETGLTAATVDEWQQFTAITEMWNSGSRVSAIDPLVCREGQGIVLQCSTATTVGNFDCFLEFTVE